jgi:hypothetical protein
VNVDLDTPGAEAAPPPHPLARELAALLGSEPAARLLLVGIGNGRNVAPFVAAGTHVDALEDDPARARAAAERFAGDPLVRVVRARYAGPYPLAGGYAAALSTSALLHGTSSAIAAAVAAIRARLRPSGALYATFGSTNDPRFGRGTQLDAATFAATAGDEAGVPHAFFDEAGLRALLDGFTALALVEADASETAGSWAHPADSTAGIVHWFVRARRA